MTTNELRHKLFEIIQHGVVCHLEGPSLMANILYMNHCSNIQNISKINQQGLTEMSLNGNKIQGIVQQYCLNSENVSFLRHNCD